MILGDRLNDKFFSNLVYVRNAVYTSLSPRQYNNPEVNVTRTKLENLTSTTSNINL